MRRTSTVRRRTFPGVSIPPVTLRPGSGALSPDEFVATFSKVTDNSDAVLLRLFMRIDANCDGTVSWDE